MGIDIKTGKSDSEKAKEEVLKEALNAFNELPNKNLKHNKFKDTYELAVAIEKTLNT